MPGQSPISEVLRRPIIGRREIVSETKMKRKQRRPRAVVRDQRNSRVDPRILLAQRRWM